MAWSHRGPVVQWLVSIQFYMTLWSVVSDDSTFWIVINFPLQQKCTGIEQTHLSIVSYELCRQDLDYATISIIIKLSTTTGLAEGIKVIDFQGQRKVKVSENWICVDKTANGMFQFVVSFYFLVPFLEFLQISQDWVSTCDGTRLILLYSLVSLKNVFVTDTNSPPKHIMLTPGKVTQTSEWF